LQKLYCNVCKCPFPVYLLGPEERALITGVRTALKAQDEGRNPRCWPLVSFGWKDADLEASGCTGIKSICGVEEDKLVFAIGGHKTFVASDCLDTEDKEKHTAFDEAMREIACSTGYPAEWTGDDWSVSFSDVVKLAVVMKNGLPDFEETARQVILLAEHGACGEFEKAMASADTVANELYEEMNR
jgi:hypothetical protein